MGYRNIPIIINGMAFHLSIAIGTSVSAALIEVDLLVDAEPLIVASSVPKCPDEVEILPLSPNVLPSDALPVVVSIVAVEETRERAVTNVSPDFAVDGTETQVLQG
jgi:hypothetical protein